MFGSGGLSAQAGVIPPPATLITKRIAASPHFQTNPRLNVKAMIAPPRCQETLPYLVLWHH